MPRCFKEILSAPSPAEVEGKSPTILMEAALWARTLVVTTTTTA